METTFADFLRASLETLRVECPDAHLEMCRNLGSREILVAVDHETVGLRCENDAVRVISQVSAPAVRILSSRRVVLDLMSSRASLLLAMRNDTLGLRGTAEDVSAFLEAFAAYRAGVVRCPSFPGILADFRRRD